jgi:hypothetical protein
LKEFLIYLIGFVILLVPMKIAAQLLKANRSGWLFSALAVILANVVNNAVNMFVPSVGYMYYGSILVAFLGMSLVVSLTLGTKFYKGSAIVLLDIFIFGVLAVLFSLLLPGVVNVSIST